VYTMWRYSAEDILYRSGDVFLPKSIKNLLDTSLYSSKDTSFYINGWTFIHIISGIIVGYIYLHLGYARTDYFYTMFIIHTIWETWQIIIGMSKPFSLTGDNNRIDIFVDTFAFLYGTYIIKNYNLKFTK
jgi:hypothetical protein